MTAAAKPDQPIDDDTRIILRVDGAVHETTLGLLFADNDPDALDRAGIIAALEAGETYAAGGGAAPDILISRAEA